MFGNDQKFEDPQQSAQTSGAEQDFKTLAAGAKISAERSLFDNTPTQNAYKNLLDRQLAPFGAAYVQELDEKKRPPLELLKLLTDEAVLVSGVPIPPFSKAESLLNDPTLQAVINPGKIEKLHALSATTPSLEATAHFREELGKDGFIRAMAIASMEFAKQTSAGVATFLGVNSGLSAQTIYRVGTEAQQALWLNALNQGVFTYGFALTESAVGSDPRSIKTRFTKETDENGTVYYRVTVDKMVIGNAGCVKDNDGNVIHPGADFLLVFAVDDPDKAPKDRSFRCFMMPRSAIGEENFETFGGEHNKIGMREVNNGNFNAVDVVVPESCLLGKPDENMYEKLMGTLDITRLFVGAMSLGTAEGGLAAAVEYAAGREQNGHTIQGYQMVSMPLRAYQARALAGRLLVMEAARMVDEAEQLKADLKMSIGKACETYSECRDQMRTLLVQAGDQKLHARCLKLAEGIDAAFEQLTNGARIKGPLKQLQAMLPEVQKATATLRDHFEKVEGGDAAVKHAKAVYKKATALAADVAALKEPTRFATETAMVKLVNSELSTPTIIQAIGTLGARGYNEDPAVGLGLGKRLRDSIVQAIYEGTSNIQRNVIAQGLLIDEVKKISSNLRQGVRAYLLNNYLTRRIHSTIIMSTSHTPVERVNAAYKIAVMDVLHRYNGSLEMLKRDWEANGVPDKYKDWDKKSIERQQNFVATLPIQARLGILADMACERKLLHLASRHLEYLARKGTLTAQEQDHKTLLTIFEQSALERVFEFGRKMDSESLKLQENDHFARFDI